MTSKLPCPTPGGGAVDPHGRDPELEKVYLRDILKGPGGPGTRARALLRGHGQRVLTTLAGRAPTRWVTSGQILAADIRRLPVRVEAAQGHRSFAPSRYHLLHASPLPNRPLTGTCHPLRGGTVPGGKIGPPRHIGGGPWRSRHPEPGLC